MSQGQEEESSGGVVIEEGHLLPPDAASSSPGTKRKNKSPKQDGAAGGLPKRPKRPKTAYHFFYDIRRMELVGEAERAREKVDNNKISARIGEEWKSMKEKGEYERMAAAARVEYDEVVAAFEATGRSMGDCQPKKPLSAYMLFFLERHAKSPEAHVTDFAKETGKLWKELDESGKEKYLLSAKKQRDMYEDQTRLLGLSKRQLVGQTFVDVCASSRNATIAYDSSADLYSLEYEDDDDDDEKANVAVGLRELRARICGDEKAVKKFRDARSSKKKRKMKRIDTAGPVTKSSSVVVAAAPARTTSTNPVEGDDDKERAVRHALLNEDKILSDEEMHNVIRISRRLIGGACVQNLKKMCMSVRLSCTGSKALLGTRLELYLRDHNFKDHPFKPSDADVQNLSIDDFNAKYENETPHSIDDVVAVLAKMYKKDKKK